MPQETRDSLERARVARERLGKFTGVPDSWEGWAVRVLTIAVALMIVVSLLLLQLVLELRSAVEEGRQQRVTYQSDETHRQCALLEELGISRVEQAELGC